MKLEALRRNAQKELDRWNAYLEKMSHLTDEEREQAGEAPFDSGTLVQAEHIIHLCDDVFPAITEEERERINAIPTYQKDLRSVKDIKDRYGLTWTEVEWLRETDTKKNRLKTARETAGLSQSQLAERSGIGIRTIQSYECGARSINDAKVTTVIALADAIGADVRDLIEATE